MLFLRNHTIIFPDSNVGDNVVGLLSMYQLVGFHVKEV